MQAIQVRLFAPGGAAGGVTARLGAAGGQLIVETGEASLVIPVERVVVRHGGFDGRQFLLEWPVGAEVAAVLLPPGAVDRLSAEGPAALRAQLAPQGRRDRARGRRFRLGVGLWVVLALLPVFLLGLFWINADRMAGWAAGHVSLAQERQLGELAFAQMRPTLKLIESGPAPDLVSAIGGRLTTGSAYRYQWFVADSPEVNAFAMPGGYVVVYTGLLRAADSAEAVAGVLAHEVQHVELRHSLRNLIHGLGWRAVLALALGDFSGGVWGDMAEQLGAMAYSRDLERQADLRGLAALRRAGISPHGMVSFFEKLAREEAKAPAWLSSHPAGTERMAALRAAIAEQGDYAAMPLAYDMKRLSSRPK